MSLESVAGFAGKPVQAVTRRDVARWLVSAPDATEALPGLRRELVAAGSPLSAEFWDSAEALLARIREGRATIGDVQGWLEATGSEPTKIIGLHVWESEGERKPRAEELYRDLVEHLQTQVDRGTIDPDRLLAGDPEALRAYVEIQERWLEEPHDGADSRSDVLFDEANEDFFADWADADAEAGEALDEVLAGVGERPCPTTELHGAAERLRAGLASDRLYYGLLASCGGLRELPDDDRELWLALATGVVAPVDEPPERYEPSLLGGWYALMHADWLCAVGELARAGPGAPAGADDLARYVADSDLAEGDLDEDDQGAVAGGFLPVAELWQVLGAVDESERLTRLGWWGLPEALRRSWTASEDENEDDPY